MTLTVNKRLFKCTVLTIMSFAMKTKGLFTKVGF